MASSGQCHSCGFRYNQNDHSTCPRCKAIAVEAESTDLGDGKLSESAKRIILSTTSKIQGKEISEHLGLIAGSGNSAWTLEGSAQRANTALNKAEKQLRIEAAHLKADGVIGILFSMDGGQGVVSKAQSITLLGTAVKFR